MRDRILALLAAIAFAVFLVLAVLVKYVQSPGVSDLQAAVWVNRLSVTEPLNTLLVYASLYGREYFWIPLVAVMFLLGDRRTKLVAAGLCGAFIAGILVGEVAKEVVARARPPLCSFLVPKGITCPIPRVPLDTDYSFPSGHAVITSIGAVYSLLTFRRKWVAVLLLVEAAVVSFSRVYVFAHYPTDVLAGFAIGSALALAVQSAERMYLRKQGDAVADYLVKLFKDGPLRL